MFAGHPLISLLDLAAFSGQSGRCESCGLLVLSTTFGWQLSLPCTPCFLEKEAMPDARVSTNLVYGVAYFAAQGDVLMLVVSTFFSDQCFVD